MPRAPIRVFLVDDHPILRRGLRATLGRSRFELVGDTASAKEALAVYGQLAPDVTLVDVRLGDGSGVDLTRELREAHGDSARIVIFTAYDEPAIVAAALDAGARGYVVKSGGPDHLFDAITSALAGQIYLCPEAEGALRRWRQHAVARLTERERQIVPLLVDGLTTKQIAQRLGIAWRTVSKHRENLYRKLGTRNVAELIRWARSHGVAQLD